MNGASGAVADPRGANLGMVRTLLLDADGNLFPSEEPAFEASAEVVNRLMDELGSPARFDGPELRLTSTGRSFRAIAASLADACDVEISPATLERWVAEEREAVAAHLARVLTPDEAVLSALRRLSTHYELAVVSSSALTRLDACFRATGLADLLPADRRFSAEDSLPRPTSKPDPAVYLASRRRLGIQARHALAVEDSSTGARSAVAAGIATVGNVCFVAGAEREARVAELREVGVCEVVSSWMGLERLLADARARDDLA